MWWLFDRICEVCLMTSVFLLWIVFIEPTQQWYMYTTTSNCTLEDIFIHANCDNEDVDVIELSLLILIYYTWLGFFTMYAIQFIRT